ncbi:MAG: hypothetical protein U0667_15290 [Chloroflexota bacterium]
MAAEFALLSATAPGFTRVDAARVLPQEFDLRLFDAETARAIPDRVGTWVQCITTSEGYPRFRSLAARTGLDWRWYGHCGEADEHWGGNMPSTCPGGRADAQARIAWHWKAERRLTT